MLDGCERGQCVGMGLHPLPVVGACCHYANRNATPDGWPLYASEIECRCSIESCPATLAEAEQSLCAVITPSTDVQRFVGCGLVAVADYSGYEWVFEQLGDSATPASRLIGASKFSDASSFDAGATSSWTAGRRVAECDYGPAFECQLCGDSPDTDFPPCQ